MTDDWLTDRFEDHRTHLHDVAYRMLGSSAEADDAVQEAWLRLNRTGGDEIDNLGGWLTTVVARVSLNMLRSRRTRRESALDEAVEPQLSRLPDPIVTRVGESDPAEEAVLADSVGVALLVVLDQLSPAERLAFVLHDLFAVPFEEIAPIVGRSHDATRQLASRARRRVRGAAPTPDRDVARQREVVDAFFAAARGGDFTRLVGVLHPDVVLNVDYGPEAGGITSRRGAETVASQALMFAEPQRISHPVLVNGAPGVVNTVDGEVIGIMAFTVVDGRIVEIEVYGEPGLLTRVAALLL
jgi:RNA polymerase sigma-70 factor (ECF subfamily)